MIQNVYFSPSNSYTKRWLKDLAAARNLERSTASDKKLTAQLARLARANDAAQEALRSLLTQAERASVEVVPGLQTVVARALAAKAGKLLLSRRVRGRLVRLLEVMDTLDLNLQSLDLFDLFDLFDLSPSLSSISRYSLFFLVSRTISLPTHLLYYLYCHLALVLT